MNCDECGCEVTEDNQPAEFEGTCLCRECLEAIAWIKGWSKGEEKIRYPCPLCGEPMADFSTMDEVFFRCEECGRSVVDRNIGIKIVI